MTTNLTTQHATEARKLLAMSPAERSEEKRRLAIRWVHAWGFSTTNMLCFLCEIKNRTFVYKMVDDGFLLQKKILGTTILLATRKGIEYLKNICDENDPVLLLKMQRSPIVFGSNHSLICQQILAKKIIDQGSDALYWRSERELRSMTKPGEKVCDATITTDIGTIFIEVELTKKHGRELGEMIASLAKSVAKRKDYGSRAEIHTNKNWTRHYQQQIDDFLKTGEFDVWERNIATGQYFSQGKEAFSRSRIQALETMEIVSLD